MAFSLYYISTMRIVSLTILLAIASFFMSGFTERAMAEVGSLANQIAEARISVTNSLLDLRVEAERDLVNSSKAKNETNSTAIVDYVSKIHQKEIFPLLENKVLNEVAQTLCAEAISKGLTNIDDNTTRPLLEKAGYKANASHVYALGIIMKEYIQPGKGSQLLLKNFLDALNKNLIEGHLPAFLDNRYKEIGVGFCGGAARISESQRANMYVLVAILASPKGPQPEWVQCGHVYYDLNNNHSYDPGEGLREVLLSDENGTLLAQTLYDGQYCFRRPKGNWILYIETFPFMQDYTNYNRILAHRKDGILWQDYPLLLTQGTIDAKRKNEDAGKE